MQDEIAASVCFSSIAKSASLPGVKPVIPFLLSLLLCPFASLAEENPTGKSGKTHELVFPEIGPTLFTLSTGKENAAKLLYRLPDNFSPEKKYPVFVFLTGGTGDGMEKKGLGRAVSITGGNDYITATLPLFRRGDQLNEEELFGGLLIGVDDFPVISQAYGVMLKRFFEAVPNAKKTGNFMGGFSNGAHTTAFLVSGQDETVLKHFQHFILADGGIWMSSLQRHRMKACSFLGLYGDTDKYWTRPVIMQQFKTMKMTADALEVSFELIEMKGVGHQFPAQYDSDVLEWMKRQ
jgi:hypothetical protein